MLVYYFILTIISSILIYLLKNKLYTFVLSILFLIIQCLLPFFGNTLW